MKTYGSAKYSAGVWQLDCKPHVAIRMKRLFDRVQQTRTGTITITDTADVCRDLEWVLDRYPMQMSDEDRARITRGAERNRSRELALDAVLGGYTVPAVRIPLREPRDYQRVAADLALKVGRLLLVDEMGLGKTMSAYTMLKANDALPAVVVCQPHLTTQWLDQLKITWGELRGHIVRTSRPYDLSRACGGTAPDVVIVPYSKLGTWADALAPVVSTVIFDEMQELRTGPGTQKYTGAALLAEHARYKIGLTGTPVYNYGAEIHALVDILEQGALGTLEEFKREWCVGDKGKVQDPVALGEFLREQSLMLVRTRADVGRELPPALPVVVPVEADAQTLREAQGNAVEIARLILASSTSQTERFVAGGQLDIRMRAATGIAKAPFVAEFVRMLLQTQEKVVLFGWHRDVYDIWLEQLAEFNPVMYTGSETAAGKNRSKRAFVHGDARILIMSLRSGAGVDGLQTVCSSVVFGELDWSPKVHEQGIGRLRRDDGSEDSVFAYYCVADDGSDPVIAEALNLKDQQANAIVHGQAELFTPTQEHNRLLALAESIVSGAKGTSPSTGAAATVWQARRGDQLVGAGDFNDLVEGLCPGYLDVADAQQRLIRRTRLALDIQRDLQAGLLADADPIDVDHLTASQRAVLDGSHSGPVAEWDSPVPLVLLTTAYQPYSPTARPEPDPEHPDALRWLDPYDDESLIRSLHEHGWLQLRKVAAPRASALDALAAV